MRRRRQRTRSCDGKEEAFRVWVAVKNGNAMADQVTHLRLLDVSGRGRHSQPMQARVLRYLRLYSPRVCADGTMLTTTLSTALSLSFTLQTNGPARLTVASPKDVAQDSQRIVRGARAAQASFESTRRLNLPVTPGGSGGRCDVRVGR